MGKVRVQFEMLEENAAHLDALAKQIGVTKRDIINNALTLLDWSIGEVQQSRIIASVDEETDRYKELILPILGAFKEAARAQQEQEVKVTA